MACKIFVFLFAIFALAAAEENREKKAIVDTYVATDYHYAYPYAQYAYAPIPVSRVNYVSPSYVVAAAPAPYAVPVVKY